MPDFAPNFTARYRLKYSVVGTAHTMTWRFASGFVDEAGAADKVAAVINAMHTNLYESWEAISADFAPADSDVFLPSVISSFDAGTQTDPTTTAHEALAVSFIGRSASGGKARMFLYGTNLVEDTLVAYANDWRVLSGESANVLAAVAELNAGSPDIYANDNVVVTWYPYINLKFNDRWVRKLRRG
jgi:hypothetical protein